LNTRKRTFEEDCPLGIPYGHWTIIDYELTELTNGANILRFKFA
jgi:hypothetical protein